MNFDKKLDLILSQPEGQFTEFKSSVSASLNREIVAFANSGGGHIIVGVDNNGKIVGILDINNQISRLESIARNCDPPVPLRISSHTRDGKEILVVEVPDGEDKPYSCSSGFYLRSGASTQKMTRNEIVEFLYSVGQVRWDEKACRDFRYPDDFDEDAFRYFLDNAKITSVGMSTEDLLINIGVAEHPGERLIFNNTGVLFFAKEPIRFLRHAIVDCMLLAGTEKVDILDRKELKGNLMENVKQAMIFLKMHLPLRYEIEGLKRKEFLEIPEAALREAVLNAVMHRDYHFDSAWITVEVYRDRVEISDPGGLPPGMKPEDLGKKSVHRNRMIADLFHRMGEVEKAGSGINRIRDMLATRGLSEPRFEFTSFFTIIFDRKPQVTPQVTPQFTPQVTPQVRKMLEACKEPRSRAEILHILGLSDREHLRKAYILPALDSGWLVMTIPGKPRSRKQKYVTTENGKKMMEVTGTS